LVVDTSAILAMFFAEPGGPWVADQLAEASTELRMSTVNLAEALILIRDRQPALADALEERLLASGIRFVAPDEAQARIAAKARLRFPLNLGDCFAYALAVVAELPILSTDLDFRAVDVATILPPAVSATQR
jgi:ribonuclease VapC